MKRILTLLFSVLTLFAVGAQAAPNSAFPYRGETLVCERYGHTDNPDDFHNIKLENKRSVFSLTSNKVTLDGVKYFLVNPSWVGLEGVALTYHSDNFNKVLYLYVTDKGDREVGISSIEPDSDTVFRDKTVFQGCDFKEEVADGSSEQILRTNGRGIQSTLPVYTL